MTVSPSHRSDAIKLLVLNKQACTSTHAFEQEYYLLIKNNECSLSLVQDATDWANDPQIRHLLNALILGKATDSLISDILDMPPEPLQAYRHLFFDRQVFKSAIYVIRYINELDIPSEWQEYYSIAVQQGPEYLAGKFAIGKRPEVDPRAVKREVLAAQYERFKNHINKPTYVNGEINKEVEMAMRYGKEAVTTAVAILEKGESGSEHALKQLKIVLIGDTKEKNPEQPSIKKEDILF